MRIGLILALVVALGAADGAAQGSAQSRRLRARAVFRALADLRTALDGTYGDEGSEVARRLADLSEAVGELGSIDS